MSSLDEQQCCEDCGTETDILIETEYGWLCPKCFEERMKND